MPIAEARQILGKDFIIGGTANTFEDVQMHYQAGAEIISAAVRSALLRPRRI